MEKREYFFEKTQEGSEGTEYRCWETVYTKEGGYVDSDVAFDFISSGKLRIWDRNKSEFVYLSRYQVAELSRLFRQEEEQFVIECNKYGTTPE